MSLGGRRWPVLVWVIVVHAGAATAARAETAWKAVATGVEYAVLHPDGAPSDAFHVVRIDPRRARLRAVMATARDRKPRTAGAWCGEAKLVAAINMGMYLDDHLSNVGHAHSGKHVNRGKWVSKYGSVLALGPRRAELPAAVLLDLDTPDARARIAEYDTVIQNLRIIRAPGRSVVKPQARRWSEAAVAMDRAGRVLLLFARAPHSLHEFNHIVLSLPLAIVTAMHVEGGPEASLSLRGPVTLDLNGSFETGFNENEGEVAQWPLPNALGVEAAAR